MINIKAFKKRYKSTEVDGKEKGRSNKTTSVKACNERSGNRFRERVWMVAAPLNQTNTESKTKTNKIKKLQK